MSSQEPVIFPLWAFADSKTGMKMRPLDPALLLLREGESAKLSSSYIERSEKRKLRGPQVNAILSQKRPADL